MFAYCSFYNATCPCQQSLLRVSSLPAGGEPNATTTAPETAGLGFPRLRVLGLDVFELQTFQWIRSCEKKNYKVNKKISRRARRLGRCVINLRLANGPLLGLKRRNIRSGLSSRVLSVPQAVFARPEKKFPHGFCYPASEFSPGINACNRLCVTDCRVAVHSRLIQHDARKRGERFRDKSRSHELKAGSEARQSQIQLGGHGLDSRVDDISCTARS